MQGDFGGISVKGAMFSADSPVPFQFFKEKSARMAIVYGKNGSGKSTISRAFYKCKDETCNPELAVQLIDVNRAQMIMTPETLSQIQVFNEDFISKNLRTEEKGLNTIIMLGEQVELDDKIKQVEKTLAEATKIFTEQEVKCREFDDATSVTSPMYYIIIG